MMKLLFILFSLAAFGYPTVSQNIGNGKDTIERNIATKSLREMQTDRPDVTESPYTVDAGHFQIETDLFKESQNTNAAILSVKSLVNQMNLKFGLSNSIDLQLLIQSYISDYSKSKELNTSSRTSGFGDLTFRLKKNLIGNDSGNFAFGVIPFFSLPVSKFSKGNQIAGGIIFPLAIALKNTWSFSTQVQFDLISQGRSYQASILNSATLGKELNDRWSIFVEGYDTYHLATANIEVFFDSGVVYSLSRNFNLDAGFNYGLTRHSDKSYFIGLSFRL